MQGCVSQRYLPFALHIPSNAIHYNLIIVITLDWLYLGFLTQESSLAQICTLSAFTRNLQRHSAPTVGFEPTDLSAHQFSRLLAYNHLHTLAWFPYKTTLKASSQLGQLSYNRTSGNLPESPTTAPHGHWSYLSGKVFSQDFLAGWFILFSGKMDAKGLEPVTAELWARCSNQLS